MIKMKIKRREISSKNKTFFIADIAANHDGKFNRAIKLIDLAIKAGADAVKFQHHDVKKYVSDYGFKALGAKQSHQKKWKKSIFQVYKDAEVPIEWTKRLFKYCKKKNIIFMSTPYDLDMVDHLFKYVQAYKIGSGDLAWKEMIKKVSSKNKPIFIATGASNINEVDEAVKILRKKKTKFCLMQCNTNYTGSLDNFKFINLNVIKTYAKRYKNILLGLSDHTPGHETVLGAVAMGVRVVEKHFTDNTNRSGPDHPFSMDPVTWRAMVNATRKLESAMGNGKKVVENNELETVILQRRSIRLIKNVKKNDRLKRSDIEFQRPCPKDALNPNEFRKYEGRKYSKNFKSGLHLKKRYFI